MAQGTLVTRLINAVLLGGESSRALILLAFAAAMTHCAQAQNIEGQPIAAQYGEFKVQNEGNGFSFDPANCNVTGGGENFPAFATGTPVKVVDALPAQTEVATTVTAFLSGSNCAVSLFGLAYQHTSFYLTSGTGGLQEALNNEKIRAGGNNTIILNARWYELVAPRTASAVISTVSGGYSFGLVDITTNPYTSYNWNGSQYVQAATVSGGSPSGAAGGALSGNYPNPGLSSNPIALPAGSTATTCTAGENDTNVATNACVAAALSGPLPPGTRGEPLTNISGAASYSASQLFIDASQFTGATVAEQVNACITAAIAIAGTCDARALGAKLAPGQGIPTAVTTDTQITVGDSAGDPVTLLLPASFYWVGGMTDGTSCTLAQYPNTAVIGQGTPNGNAGVFGAANTSNLGYVYCTKPIAGADYYYDFGFSIFNYSNGSQFKGHATANNIGSYIEGPAYDQSLWSQMNFFDGLDTYDVYVGGVCCNTTFRNSEFNGNYGSIPLYITGSTAVSFDHSNFVHPLGGQPAFECAGGSIVSVDDAYTETSNSNTSETIYYDNGCSRLSLHDITMKAYVNGMSAPGLTVANTAGSQVLVDGLSMINGAGDFYLPATAVVNSLTGQTIQTDSAGNLPYYDSAQTGSGGTVHAVSPALAGTPTAPIQAISTNNTDIATTAAVTSALSSYAPLASPPFTGTIMVNGSTSGSASISASASGGTLNLGSTNATVSPAGALTITSCIGCSGPPTGPASGAFTGTYPGPSLAVGALPNGMTATTQGPIDNSSRVATDAAVQAAQSDVIVANVKQYGAVGNGSSNPACAYLSLANLAALQAYNGGIFSFATSCTNQMDWLAMQYAVNKLTSSGGSIKLSGGPYIWDRPVILPNSQDAYTGSSKGIYLLGDGEGGTLIEPAVADFGANSGMISCGPPAASYSDNSGAGSGRYGGVGACYGGITDITFYNPYSDTYNGGANVNVSSSAYARGITNVPAPGYSGAPIQMDGVLLGGRMNLKRVGSWGFRMGFNLVGDHMTWDQIDAEKDFCGLYWAPASIYLVGDIIMQGHNFVSGNTFAGTCVDKDASIIGLYQSGEYYTGYQPYAFIKFPGVSDSYGEAYGGAYTPFLANANYDIIQSEAIGNAVMWDDNLTNSAGGVQTGQASIGGVKINGIYTVFGSASGQKITTGGRGSYAYFGSGSFNGFRLGNIYAGASNFFPTAGQLAGIIANNAAYNDGGIDISGDMNNILNQYTAIEFVGVAATGSTMCQNVALHEPGVWDGGEVAIYPAATEPAVGNVLQVFSYQAGTIANGTQPAIGVAEQALTTNTAGGQCVAYANHGIATVSTASTPALGALLVATTAGQATAATAAAGGYDVGTVHNNITNPPVQLSLGGFTPGTNTLSVYAPLASPALTGTPTSPTAAPNSNGTQLATTAYAQNPGPITPTTVTASGVVTTPGLFLQSKAAGPYAVWFDDFFSTANNSLNQIGGTLATCSANNTYADANHPGNILLNSSTTSGDGVTCGLQSTSGAVVGPNTASGWMWETAVYVPSLPGTTAGAYQAGLSGGPNASPWTNGIGFYLSSANTTANDWYIRYGSTSTDCSIAAVAATWTRLSIVNDGTNVHWYVNGTQCGTGVAIGSMPTNTMYAANWSAVTLTASTAVTMAVDYVDFQRAVNR
jgi:hypothetical protein